MKRPPYVILAFDMRFASGQNYLRGIAAFVERNRHWDCNYNWIDEVTAGTIRRAKSADGMIAHIENRRVASALSRLKIPVVGIGQLAAPVSFPSVGVDAVAIGKLAAKHLIDRGFRHFGYCSIYGLPSLQTRGRAFESDVRAAGCSCDWFRFIHRPVSKTWPTVHVELIRWVKQMPKPVGIFTAGDSASREVAKACRDAGIPIPEQVAILGAGNDELTCRLCTPILSSIEPRHVNVGYEAARLLQRRMDGRSVPKRPLLIPPGRVVTRQSTDIVMVDDPNVAAALRYIQDNLANGVDVKQLVQHMSVSRRTLEMEFRKQLGRTIHDEIVLAKFHRASQFLADGQTTLTQITQACGMGHPSRLNRLIRKCAGMTPMQYRNAGVLGKLSPATVPSKTRFSVTPESIPA